MKFILIVAFLLLSIFSSAQELFIQKEPASTIPKKVIGIRIQSKGYKEIGLFKSWCAVRLMYGLTRNITVGAAPSFSNHHGRNLPSNFISHYHSGNQTYYYNGQVYTQKYGYRFEGVNLNLRYRFYSKDGKQQHFRLAAFAEFATGKSAHDEAEPNLSGDNAGFGAGIIATVLKKRFAVSFSGESIFPSSYHETYNNESRKINYGNAFSYNLSFGYMILPARLKNYDQLTTNIYLEFTGEAYAAAKVYLNEIEAPVSTNILNKNNYIDITPGLQLIIKSNLRIDLSAGFKFYKTSYSHFYPLYGLAVQRYFYPQKK